MSNSRSSTPRRKRLLADEPANAVRTIGMQQTEAWRGRRRYLVWLVLIPAAFAAYYWLPWLETWIETGLLLMLIACLFVIDEMSRSDERGLLHLPR